MTGRLPQTYCGRSSAQKSFSDSRSNPYGPVSVARCESPYLSGFTANLSPSLDLTISVSYSLPTHSLAAFNSSAIGRFPLSGDTMEEESPNPEGRPSPGRAWCFVVW